MEKFPPQELIDIYTQLSNEFQEKSDVDRRSKELYAFASKVLEEFDVDCDLEREEEPEKRPRHTKLINLPFGESTSIILYSNSWIGISHDGIRIGLMGKDDKERDYLIEDLFTLRDLSAFNIDMFSTYDHNDGRIKTLDNLEPVGKILAFIKASVSQ